MGDGMTERFRQEAVTIARLHHPNIVPVYAVRHGEGLHYFVMRYVQGRSLDQVIQRAGRLPLPIVRSILWQVAAGARPMPTAPAWSIATSSPPTS